MPIFRNIRESIARSSKSAAGITKAAGSLREGERELRNSLRELGEKYDEIFGDHPDGALAPMVERVRNARAAIDAAQKSLDASRGVIRCPSCGMKASIGMRYCPDCGQILPSPPNSEAEEEGLFCPWCSRPVNPDLRFCTYCSKSIDEAGAEPMELNVCPACHKLAPAGASVCPECGALMAE
ncbi:MAG: zinc ribbon domain-containing protein [Eubacteriaceae bacterium]|nr:zinc ribbon domain-containing protein [Eubacteriaceae bacterium]